MKKILSFVVLSLIVILAAVAPAYAAKPVSGSRLEPVGNDISWPQCNRTLPTSHAFGIVGVNGGTAANANPCLATQLKWAHNASGVLSQPKAQLYVNTANPGEVINEITTWPTNNTDKTGFTTTNPYGDCTGNNDRPCSWQYGWNRSVYAATEVFAPSAAAANVNANTADYVWWLDVETMNTWQSGSNEALARNAAALEGMAAYYQAKGALVGVYSTNYQWGQIVGTTITSASNLNGLDSWLAGARSLKGAKTNCKNPALTAGGKVTLTQYVSGSLDYDYSCVN